jgi:hypothetical protein
MAYGALSFDLNTTQSNTNTAPQPAPPVPSPPPEPSPSPPPPPPQPSPSPPEPPTHCDTSLAGVTATGSFFMDGYARAFKVDFYQVSVRAARADGPNVGPGWIARFWAFLCTRVWALELK